MHDVSAALTSLMLIAAPALAQAPAVPGYTIDALAADVVARNPERRFLGAQIDLARTGVRAAGRLADPEVSVEFGERRTDSVVTGQRLGDGPAFAVSVVQPIEFNGRVALRRAIAERQVRLAQAGLAQFDATLAGRARTLGYRLFAAGEKADAAADVAGRMRALARVLVARDPAGPAPRLEATVLEAAAISAERNAAQATADYNLLLHELNGLRGEPFAARLRIVRPPAAIPPLPDAAVLAERARTRNFELVALREQLGQQGLQVDLARRGRIGQVAIGPYFSHDRGDVDDRQAGVRVTTTLPVWNRQAGDVAAAQGRQAQGEAALIAAERRIAGQVHNEATLYRARVEALARWPVDAPQRFADAAAAADASFRLGAVPLATYVQMQTSYLDALGAVLDTRAGAWEAHEQLRMLTGGEPVAE